MARGDSVEVVYQVGDSTASVTIAATKVGRTVEVNRDKRDGTIEVAEATRGGTAKYRATFRADAVIALIERPNERDDEPE
jgi:hypothetical protein